MKANKKVVISTATVLGAAALIAGGTIAYFSDKDTATNTFTVGDVDIVLNEKDFDGNVLPTTQNLAPGNSRQAVPKVATVTVDQNGQDAWVWVEMSIPAPLYNSKDHNNESNNAIHYNQFIDYLDGYNSRSANPNAQRMASQYNDDHQWSVFEYVGQKTVGNKEYAVLRTTHKDIVTAGSTTSPALAQIYMDDDVHYETIGGVRKLLVPTHGEWGGAGNDNYTATYTGADKWTEYAGDWEVVVNAYGMQTVGFSTVDDAIAAYVARAE